VGKYPSPNSIPKIYPGTPAFYHTRHDYRRRRHWSHLHDGLRREARIPSALRREESSGEDRTVVVQVATEKLTRGVPAGTQHSCSRFSSGQSRDQTAPS
jgi:hypothetical protein